MNLFDDYVRMDQFVKSGMGGVVLPSLPHARNFTRQHRRELEDAGAMIMGRGQRPTIVHVERFSRKVLEIFARESMRPIERAKQTEAVK